MKLVIVSHTPHYRRGGDIVGWGPTVREIDYLARLFDEVVHVAPLHPERASKSALAYDSSRIRFRPVAPAGGHRFEDKVRILINAPGYLRVILEEFRDADVVHVRCPANISLLTIVLLALKRTPTFRWVKYAGNWCPNGREPWSYTFQRWWLARGLHRGVVTINGRWLNQPEHVFSFLNPCLTEREVCEARRLVSRKELSEPVRLLYVGRVEEAKGTGRVLRILAKLHQRELPVRLDIIGDGPQRHEFEQQAETLGVDRLVTFHGWLPRTELSSFYTRAHIILFPTMSSEGWPKVLSEAMAYGVVPIAGAVSSIPQILDETGAGIALPPQDIDGFARAVLEYVENPEQWRAASRAGIRAASQFTYERYLEALAGMFRQTWGIPLDKGKNL